jgi:hypothetical protein
MPFSITAGENPADAEAIQGSKGAPLEEDEELEDDELDEDDELVDEEALDELEDDEELDALEVLDALEELEDEPPAPPPQATKPMHKITVSQLVLVIGLITAGMPLGYNREILPAF